MKFLKKLQRFKETYIYLLKRVEYIQEALGRIEAKQNLITQNRDINSNEFKVYSQSGEDGILQFLINNVKISSNRFIEFGIENYLESNTRFLALNNFWKGLIIDGSKSNIEFIKNDPIYWRCQINAVESFITKDNINDIIRSSNFDGNIGILSIDIDGNDYWVWKNINCIDASIIVIEYNSYFGKEANVTVPYDPNFVRNSKHYSKIYYGASICALVNLGKEKGYSLVASNLGGNNLFFVKNEYLNNISPLDINDAYRRSNYREVHDENGKLTYEKFEVAQSRILEMDVIDLNTNMLNKIKNII